MIKLASLLQNFRTKFHGVLCAWNPAWMALLSLETSASGSVAMLETFMEGKALQRTTRRHSSRQTINLSVPASVHWTDLTFLLITNLMHFFQCIYLFPFSTCFEQPSAHHQENQIVSIRHLVYVTLCRRLPGMPVRRDRHTRQSPTQSDIYQMTYWHNLILLMMSTGLLETCREWK